MPAICLKLKHKYYHDFVVLNLLFFDAVIIKFVSLSLYSFSLNQYTSVFCPLVRFFTG